jgi:hypothetical protein
MKRIIVLFIIAFFFKSNITNAQKIDSVLNIYSDQFQQEKLHIHFDKSIYSKGETIWYKAYIMAGTDLSGYSKNFYVDWYGDNGKLLKHTVYPVFQSSARGQFEVPATYTGQSLHVRAYTQWMLNFDSAFMYNKDILVNQPNSKPASFIPVTTVNLFPEGGDLVNGISSRVAFMAVNQSGKPVKIIGAVKSNKGELIDSLTTDHDGMGSFTIEPDANSTYTVSWKDEYGKTGTANLPAIKKMGAAIQIQHGNGKSLVMVKRSTDANDTLKTLNLVANMNQQMVYRSRINLSARVAAMAEIPTGELPTGVLQITLFNAQWQPIAERVVFVNNEEYEFFPGINVVVKGVDKRAKNVLEVNLSDSVVANMSVSVTDADLANDASNTVVSQLLLCGDLKGYIHNPAYYFSNAADSTKQQLDLVMLTHGWRRYNWEDIVKARMPFPKHARETEYLKIKGTVYGNTKTPGQSIMLFMQSLKDTANKVNRFPSLNQDGSFSVDDIMFYDTLKIYYALGNAKADRRSEVAFQSGAIPMPPIISGNSISKYLWDIDSAQLARNLFFQKEQDKLAKLLQQTTLQEVVVKTKAKKPMEILDEKYASGMFSGGDGYQFDVANDPRGQSAMNIFTYLQGMVAGLQISFNNGEPTLTWRGATPELFLDELRSDPDMLNGISMADVAYVKVFRPPFFGATGGGAGGAIAVYTKKGGGSTGGTGKGLDYKLLAGYTTYKEFYAPNYSVPATDMNPDVRTTLFWAPYILTDKTTHKVKLEFYNNDYTKKFRVILEGVNADGKIARIEKIIQ